MPTSDKGSWLDLLDAVLASGIEISINGQEIVFDNVDHDGVPREEWLQNLTSPTVELGRGSFNLTQEDF